MSKARSPRLLRSTTIGITACGRLSDRPRGNDDIQSIRPPCSSCPAAPLVQQFRLAIGLQAGAPLAVGRAGGIPLKRGADRLGQPAEGQTLADRLAAVHVGETNRVG